MIGVAVRVFFHDSAYGAPHHLVQLLGMYKLMDDFLRRRLY